MCGRYVIEIPPEEVAKFFGLPVPPEFPARYNVAPTQQVPVVRQANDETRRIDLLRWGLIPSWAKEKTSGLINARSETVGSKPSFRQAFQQRRCILPASGFYEWQKRGAQKIPHYIHMANNAIMPLAGIWEAWRSPEGQVIETCAILTTAAKGVVSAIHDRMPVILNVEDLDLWLDRQVQDPERLQRLLSAVPEEQIVAYPVSSLVNKPVNDSPECIRPI